MGNILFHLQFPAPAEIPQIKLESFFESIDGWEPFTFGGGTVSLDVDKVVLSTQGGAGAIAAITQRLAYPPGPLEWSKKRTFKLKARVDVSSDANSQIYILTGYEGANQWAFGFRFTNTMVRGFAKNGGAEQYVNLVTGLTAPYVRDELYEVTFTPGSKIEFYIDGVLKGTLTAGLPTGTTHAEKLFRLFVYSVAAAIHEIRTSYVKVTQDL